MWCVTFIISFRTNINSLLSPLAPFLPPFLSLYWTSPFVWVLVSAENVITVYDCPSVGTMLNGTNLPFSSLSFPFFFFLLCLYNLILNLFQREIVIHVFRIARHLWAPCWMAQVSFLSFLFPPSLFPLYLWPRTSSLRRWKFYHILIYCRAHSRFFM